MPCGETPWPMTTRSFQALPTHVVALAKAAFLAARPCYGYAFSLVRGDHPQRCRVDLPSFLPSFLSKQPSYSHLSCWGNKNWGNIFSNWVLELGFSNWVSHWVFPLFFFQLGFRDEFKKVVFWVPFFFQLSEWWSGDGSLVAWGDPSAGGSTSWENPGARPERRVRQVAASARAFAAVLEDGRDPAWPKCWPNKIRTIF